MTFHAHAKLITYSVGLTTVYRTLQALSAAGEVDVILREDGESVYRMCSDAHHHHRSSAAAGQEQEAGA